MAKKKPAKTRKTRSRRQSALGSPPGDHKTREETFAKQANEKISQMQDALKGAEPKCGVAFARLIDVVSYSGMAEAEAVGHGEDGRKYSTEAVKAIHVFKRACKVE